MLKKDLSKRDVHISKKNSINSNPLSSSSIALEKSTTDKSVKNNSHNKNKKKHLMLTTSYIEKLKQKDSTLNFSNLEHAKKELNEYINYLSANNSGQKSKPKLTKVKSATHKTCLSEMKINSDLEMKYITTFNFSHKKIPKEEREKMFNQTYERFNKLENEKQQKLEELKKSLIEKEKKTFRQVPQINSQSKMLVKSSDDFLTRMKEKDKQLEKKKKTMAEEIEKKEKEKLEKEKILVQRSQKLNKDEINSSINKMYEWEQKRKEKISLEKKKNEQKTLSKIQSRPQINKKSNKIAVQKNQLLKSTTLVDRLYKEDVEKLSQKKMILNQIYTPTFTPKINTDRKYDKSRARVLTSSYAKDYLPENIETLLRDKIIKNRGRTVSRSKE